MVSTNAWLPADVAALAAMWLAGTPAREIARALGRGRESVLRRTHRDGLPGRPSPIHAPTPESAARNARRAALREERLAPAPAAIVEEKPMFLAPIPRPCLFPMWGNVRPTHLYCGTLGIAGRSYCVDHHAACYVKAISSAEAQYL